MDLNRLLSPAEVAAATREAEFLGLPIGKGSDSQRARSELERRFLALCLRHRLPKPAVNVKVDRYEVDFLWPGRRLIVEVDGWASHGTRSSFEDDRARDVRLAVSGYRVARFTWRQITDEGPHVAKAVRALLQHARGSHVELLPDVRKEVDKGADLRSKKGSRSG